MHILESSHPYCSRNWILRHLNPATPKVPAIDGFWGKRYNAEFDGARKSTVPIILTVGIACRAFSSGSVNGGVRSQAFTNFLSLYIE